MGHSIIRSFSTPEEIFKKAEKIAKKIGSNLNKVHIEGFHLWVEKQEAENGSTDLSKVQK